MTKMKKGFISLALSMVLIITASVPVLAAARSYTCDSCGRGNISAYNEYGGWYWSGGTYECPHCGTCKVMARDVTQYESCSYCGVTYKLSSWTETEIAHN